MKRPTAGTCVVNLNCFFHSKDNDSCCETASRDIAPRHNNAIPPVTITKPHKAEIITVKLNDSSIIGHLLLLKSLTAELSKLNSAVAGVRNALATLFIRLQY